MGNLSSLNFNAENVEPSQDRTLIPAGDYKAMIIESEMKTTNRGDGQYLKLTFQIVEGDQQNRMAWANLNLSHANPKAEEIAHRELSAICRAIGIMAPDDSSELHDKPLTIKIGVKPASGQYEASNAIKGYAPAGGAVSKPKQQDAAAAAKRPWEK